jgi:hypothetical protein
VPPPSITAATAAALPSGSPLDPLRPLVLLLAHVAGHPYPTKRRPRGKSAEGYLETFRLNCSPADFADVIAALVQKAKAGHAESCRIIVDRVLPSLSAHLNVDVEGDFRVAGYSPSELDEKFLGLLMEGIEKRRAIEAQVKAEEARRLECASDTETVGGTVIPADFE